uniref:Ectonucleotide pyrophosphatase/phosphodiesterase 7 n=1 Tax=Sinocyclocheilus grahami TaxID=75366 RepID=A0A672LGT1_SINGR
MCDRIMLWTTALCLCLCVRSLAGYVPAHGRLSADKLLLVSFDGFRWDYDRDVDRPHLDAMAKDGVKATYVTPAFLTATSPPHFTILTRKDSQFVNAWWDNGSLPITAQRQVHMSDA